MASHRVVARIGSTALAIALTCASASPQDVLRASVDSAGKQANGDSEYSVAFSADGGVVVFSSTASNLVAGDKNKFADVFVHDVASGTTERVSVDSYGIEGNGDSGRDSAAISADGIVVVFTSRASNLVAGDKNSRQDIFVHDRSTGITECVSVDPSGANSNDDSYSPRLSADGRFVTFSSPASNLVSGDTNRTYDIFVHDRSTGVTERISVDSSGVQSNDRSDAPSISADGTTVTFCSYASNLVGGDKNGCRDVFVHDLGTGSTELVSLTTQGSQGSDDSDVSSISSDGSIVAFASYAPDLVPGDTNAMPDVFVRDRSTGTTERVSVDSSGAEAAGFSEYPSITTDGTLVAFTSNASNLVTDDTNGSFDVFVRDPLRGTTRLVSRTATGEVGNWESGASFGLEISSDGAIVAFASLASNLVSGDTNVHGDLFVVGCTTPASWSNYGSGFPGTKGVPSFRSSQNPVIGTTITLTLENSSGVPTAGLLFVGFSETDLPTAWGGDLLVLPALTIPITFSYGFDSFTGDVPNDWSLCGTTIDLQAFEADPGAAKGVSSTQGLELVLGR